MALQNIPVSHRRYASCCDLCVRSEKIQCVFVNRGQKDPNAKVRKRMLKLTHTVGRVLGFVCDMISCSQHM